MKNVLSLAILFVLTMGSVFAQIEKEDGLPGEGTLFGEYKEGHYYDKQNNKIEGLIKYTITKRAGVDIVKSFSFKKNENDEPVKFNTQSSNGFQLTGSVRVYHTIYKKLKDKQSNKKGKFARVYVGGESSQERVTLYYSLKNAPDFSQISKGTASLGAYILRMDDVYEEMTFSLLNQKHKKMLKKKFADCTDFNKLILEDKKALNMSNIQEVVNVINSSCPKK